MPAVRRLAAILAADVAGYSRLMGADEEGTHERLKAHLAELVDPKIGEHHGRIVKNTGDGLLAEFTSVVDALRCAAEAQAGMTERNAAGPADQRIEFRIGIHQGDVVVEDHDIFGDAVNVAASPKPWPNLAASVCRLGCAEMLQASSILPSRTWASNS
jgi:class 3 adenylate cyclase